MENIGPGSIIPPQDSSKPIYVESSTKNGGSFIAFVKKNRINKKWEALVRAMERYEYPIFIFLKTKPEIGDSILIKNINDKAGSGEIYYKNKKRKKKRKK